MRIRTVLRVIALVPAVVLTMAADPALDLPDNCRDLSQDGSRVVCEQRVFFHCNDERIKVANVTSLLNAPPTWDTNPPTRSVTEGAGCGALDTHVTGTADHNPIYDAPFAGFFEGEGTANIDRLTVHAHVIDVGTARIDPTSFTMEAHVVVEGRTVLPRGFRFSPQLTPSATGASREVVFTVTDVGLFGLDRPGDYADVKVTLYAYYLDTNQNAWVWDTIEVPSGITFNPSAPQGTVLRAQG